MSTVAVLNTQGAEVKKLDLSPAVFEAPVSTDCVRAAVNRQLARRRQGTASVKSRGEVRGGGAKPWRQKGTGRARAGTNRSPLWRGGSVIFGPTPREYGGRINRKVLRRAILSCLSAYAQDGALIVLEEVSMDEPKTREIVALLERLGLYGKRVLFLTGQTNENLALSARNIPGVATINCDNINTYDLTTHDVLVATSDAVARLEEMYA